MEIGDIHPAAIVAGVIGIGIGLLMLKAMNGSEFQIGILWKVLTPVVAGLGGFFIMQKMAGGD